MQRSAVETARKMLPLIPQDERMKKQLEEWVGGIFLELPEDNRRLWVDLGHIISERFPIKQTQLNKWQLAVLDLWNDKHITNSKIRKGKKMTNGSEQTLVGMVMRDGVLCQIIQHPGGSTEYVPVEEENSKSITEAFEGEDTKPQDWNPDDDTDTVISKPKPKGEHIDCSLALEAAMVKWFHGSSTGQKIRCNGNKLFKQILKDLCNILGGEWLDRIQDIED